MRVRSETGDRTTIESRYYTVENNHYWYSPFAYGSYTPYRRVIVDDPTPAFVKAVRVKLRAMKPVRHTKEHTDIDNAGMDYTYSSSGSAYGVTPLQVYDDSTVGIGVDLDSVFYHLPNSDPFVGAKDRWDQVRPTMRTRANLAVFLAELRDIKRMFEVLPHKHFKLNDWREVLKYANNQHLNWNFGWAPFLSDIKNFIRAKDTFQTRLQRFVANEGRVLIRHYGDYAPSEDEDQGTSVWGSWLYKWKRSGTISRSSTFQFTYEIPNYSRRELLWRAWADSFGLNLSMYNVWALVPWSFVIDWHLDVSHFLDSHSSDWIQPSVVFIQSCHSVKAEGEISAWVEGPSAWGSPKSDFGTKTYKYYTRSVGGLDTYSLPEDLDADKIRLSASLALSLLL